MFPTPQYQKCAAAVHCDVCPTETERLEEPVCTRISSPKLVASLRSRGSGVLAHKEQRFALREQSAASVSQQVKD